jgi:hypothetical protein
LVAVPYSTSIRYLEVMDCYFTFKANHSVPEVMNFETKEAAWSQFETWGVEEAKIQMGQQKNHLKKK